MSSSAGGGMGFGDYMNLAGMFGGLLGGGGPQVGSAPVVPTVTGSGIPLGSESAAQAMSRMAAGTNFGQPGTLSEAITPPASEEAGEPDKTTFSQRVEQFAGNLDNTLNSPAKMLGIGLLGQVDPRLVWAGLLAAGLFDKEGGV